jgi:hypothetical protein
MSAEIIDSKRLQWVIENTADISRTDCKPHGWKWRVKATNMPAVYNSDLRAAIDEAASKTANQPDQKPL